ncbi:MAG: response regulator [Lewinellaceae bacterium]|nr:response regulator [Lewinellaceae bacterium]
MAHNRRSGFGTAAWLTNTCWLLVFFHLLLPFFGFAQKARFEFFTTANGLTGNNTSTVAQDDQGFLWLVNEGKVHRFDGRNFLVYPSPDELPGGQGPFLGLASYQDSLLFVWSESACFLLDPKTEDWQQIEVEAESPPGNGVEFFQGMGRDPILLTRAQKGFSESDILRFQNHQLALVSFPAHISSLNAPFYWCAIDASGHTYLAYRDTLYQLDPTGREIAVTPFQNICTDCANLCFQFSPGGTLVLLADWRFYVLDRENNRFVPHPANRFVRPGQNHLHRFIFEKNGSIWACGADRNLMYYDAAADTLFNFQEELKTLLPNPNDFKGVFQDKTGIVWVDTRMGLLKVRPQIYPFQTYFTGLNGSNAYFSFRGMTEDAQGMIYGMFYDGIARFDPAKKQPSRIFTPPNLNPNPFDLYADGERIWVNGGQYLDPRTGMIMDVPSPFHENPVGDNGFFAKDRNGTLWWAAHYFLLSLHNSEAGLKWTRELELPEKVFNKMEALHAGEQDGKLWISFKGKLLQYDPKTKDQHWFDPADWELPVTRIMAIQEDRRGKFWLGTDAGLVYFDPEKDAAVLYSVNEGLPNNFVCGVLTEGDSCLWLSTNHGLSRFHIPTKTFVNFLEEDGLTHNEFNRKSFFKARDGRLFFGGMRGINAFFPDEVMRAYRNKNNGARMVLSSFTYTDERRDTVLWKTHFGHQPEIHLHYWDWSYTFEYALTDFGNPEEIFFSYQMEGYKDSWSAPSKFNFVRFNSLPSGEYVFRVKARDSRGQWNPNQLAVKVIVHPPWWATWWAFILYSLLFIVVVYFLRRYELNRQRLKYNLDLEKLEAERLKELDSFKSRLYTNLTHEFRTPLTVILGMAKQLTEGSWQSAVGEKEGKRISQGLNLIENNGRNLLRLINQLLDLSKLENQAFQLHMRQGDIVPYLRYLTESFQTYANSNNLSLRFFTPLESLVMDYDSEQVKQVLTNLISNAVKFTPSGGDVYVQLAVDSVQSAVGDLLLTVKDTGVGIPPEHLPHIFDRFYQVDSSATREGEGTGIGLAHTQELVKLMGGDISAVSEQGKGSSFMVRLPIRREAERKEGDFEEMEVQDWAPKVSYESEASVPEKSGLPQLLVIEDNPDVVLYLKSCLTDQYQVEVAYNGRIGIEKALEQVPDLVISDVMMPEKDGFEVCDTLKNDERTSHIPIVLLTAKADNASRIAGLRRGAEVYLSKPFDKEELLVQLKMMLDRQRRVAAYFSRKLRGGVEVQDPDPETVETIQIEDAFIQKVRQIIEAHYADENFALPQLCQKIGMSRSQLFRKMTTLIQTSPSDFIRSYRLEKAKKLLETTELNVSEVAWQVGYKDLAHFSRSFQEAFGVPPSATSK